MMKQTTNHMGLLAPAEKAHDDEHQNEPIEVGHARRMAWAALGVNGAVWVGFD